MENIIGMRFGKLVVDEFLERKNYKDYYKCTCDCGKTVIVPYYNLKTGNTKSCGCLRYEQKRYDDLTGKKFGRLTVKEIHCDCITGKCVKWLCICECGNEVIVDASKLKNGHTKSCGCYRRDASKNFNKPIIRIDLTGKRIGKLNVLSFSHSYKHTNYWLCKCDCGNMTYASTTSLNNNRKSSCGCKVFEAAYNNLKDMKFAKLTVLYKNGYYERPNGDRLVKWHCKCDCGNECDVIGSNLLNGDTKSCGCLISKGEAEISRILMLYDINFKPQYAFANSEISNLRFDFAILDEFDNVIGCIEYDGIQHFEPVKFHACSDDEAQKQYDDLKNRDIRKNKYCEDNNIPLCRISYKEQDNIDNIIVDFLDSIIFDYIEYTE